MGDLAENHELFTFLILAGSNPDFKVFLDVGTGTGVGTTRALMNGILQRTEQNARLYSVDINEPVIHKARFQYINNRKWQNTSFAQFMWGRLNKTDFLLRQDLEEFPNPGAIRPIYDLMYDREHHLWLKAPYISLAEKFDVIVLHTGKYPSASQYTVEQTAKRTCK